MNYFLSYRQISFGIIDFTDEQFQFQLLKQISFIKQKLFLQKNSNLRIIEMQKNHIVVT